jgi:uncharacterized protein
MQHSGYTRSMVVSAAPTTSNSSARPAFHIMTKPIGPICNLDCTYCFYLEKEKLYPSNENFKMSDEVLEKYIKEYISSQSVPEINFAWQGGEPTLLGVNFFRKVIELQKKYANGKKIHNALQTNGTLLDEEWCEFFAKNGFLIGLSIDGPRELHDAYRVDKKQKPTFDKVMKGISLLKQYKVEFNTLTVVNRKNSQHALKVYQFLKEIGSGFIQFIPLVERLPDDQAKRDGLGLAEPPHLQDKAPPSPVTSWSVEAKQYGKFLTEIFDHWVRHDIGTVYVQIFDVALGIWSGMGSAICVFAERCGGALAMEHDGNVYSCDHYVYPQYQLGNLMNQSLGEMVNSSTQVKFGNDKLDTLPRYCQSCEVRFACNGECPKHRFMKTPDGEAGLNYLCPSYKHFFNHINPYMEMMCKLLENRQAPASLMQFIASEDEKKQWKQAERNDLCPCGSGKKFKKCCSKD